MNLYTQFEVSTEKESGGVWKSFGKSKTAPGFLLGRMGGTNKQFGTVHASREEDREAAKNDEKKLQRIAIEVFVDSCLFGWRNVTNRGGTELPFTRENAIAVFEDLPELFIELSMFSAGRESFLAAATEADAKN